MKAEQRRKRIADLLLATDGPIAGGELSERFGVSRQIIVQDISILRAHGFDILSTHAGYVMHASPLVERVFKVLHSSGETEDELNLIVGLGGTVVDVFVWHKAYGRMAAKLNIGTREQTARFIESVRSGKSVELMSVTGGYHYHTVRADTKEILDEIGRALEARGYIAPGN